MPVARLLPMVAIRLSLTSCQPAVARAAAETFLWLGTMAVPGVEAADKLIPLVRVVLEMSRRFHLPKDMMVATAWDLVTHTRLAVVVAVLGGREPMREAMLETAVLVPSQ